MNCVGLSAYQCVYCNKKNSVKIDFSGLFPHFQIASDRPVEGHPM